MNKIYLKCYVLTTIFNKTHIVFAIDPMTSNGTTNTTRWRKCKQI